MNDWIWSDNNSSTFTSYFSEGKVTKDKFDFLLNSQPKYISMTITKHSSNKCSFSFCVKRLPQMCNASENIELIGCIEGVLEESM